MITKLCSGVFVHVTKPIVRVSGVMHRVRLTADGARCTCPWFAKHQGTRGPCKHILAVQILCEDDPVETKTQNQKATIHGHSTN